MDVVLKPRRRENCTGFESCLYPLNDEVVFAVPLENMFDVQQRDVIIPCDPSSCYSISILRDFTLGFGGNYIVTVTTLPDGTKVTKLYVNTLPHTITSNVYSDRVANGHQYTATPTDRFASCLEPHPRRMIESEFDE